MKFLLHVGLILWITFVGVFDTVITYLTKSTMVILEKNPISLFLITTFGLTFFLSIKLILTCVVAGFLLYAAFASKNKPWLPKKVLKAISVIIVAIAIFQTWLFYYLNWSGGEVFVLDSSVWNMFIGFWKDLMK
tara:strand:- start:177 stop:578 length:402 start_codon:yes stop_codon:yes gene_type:complete